MTDYYKALRASGTDFATGTTKPRKGRWLPRIDGDLIMCQRGYHVSDAAAATLAGGSWPCKLARVEIPDGEWERQGHKLVVPTYRVVEWLPAWQALGPNGEDIAALIERAKRLTDTEAQRLYAARSAAEDAAEDATVSATVSAAGYAARNAAWSAARSPAWSAAVSAARCAAWFAAEDAAGEAAGDAAWDAAEYAAGALVVRDLITPKQFAILCGPWRDVIEGVRR